MARYNKYGFAVDQVLCEDFALPNATTKDSTNTVTLENRGDRDLHVVICASLNENSDPTELASSATLEIRPVVGTTTSPTTVLPSILIKQGVQTDASWATGEVICEFTIPRLLIGSNKYMKLTFVTSANESADKIEAYLLAD